MPDAPSTEGTPPEAPAEGGEEVPADLAMSEAGKRALAAEREARRDAEKQLKAQLKAQATELEKLRRQTMTEQEQAVEAARTEARNETMLAYAGRLVDAEVKAAASGRSVDVDALLEGLDRSRFLDAAGEPDTAAIAAWIDRLAPVADPASTFPDLGQGARSGGAMALNGDPIERALRDKLGIR